MIYQSLLEIWIGLGHLDLFFFITLIREYYTGTYKSVKPRIKREHPALPLFFLKKKKERTSVWFRWYLTGTSNWEGIQYCVYLNFKDLKLTASISCKSSFSDSFVPCFVNPCRNSSSVIVPLLSVSMFLNICFKPWISSSDKHPAITFKSEPNYISQALAFTRLTFSI